MRVWFRPAAGFVPYEKEWWHWSHGDDVWAHAMVSRVRVSCSGLGHAQIQTLPVLVLARPRDPYPGGCEMWSCSPISGDDLEMSGYCLASRSDKYG